MEQIWERWAAVRGSGEMEMILRWEGGEDNQGDERDGDVVMVVLEMEMIPGAAV